MSTAVQESLDRNEPTKLQEQLIEAQGRRRQLAMRQALTELKQLSEQCNWFGRVVDMSDISTFGDEGRPWFIMDRATAESRALVYPGATASAYINESEFRLIRARSRAFVLTNPYWKAIVHSRRVYTVGSGHAYKVVPQDDDGSDELKDLVSKVSDEIELFCKVNRYRRRQNEKVTRLDRDGEFFLRYDETNPDGVLRVRFIEPLLVWTPPGKDTTEDVWFGIQFKGDYENPLGYYIRPANSLGNTLNEEWSKMIPADEIQHRTANVDMSSPRGLPTTYDLQARLEQALKTLSNMGALVEFRTKIGLIRKHINATVSTVSKMIQSGAMGGSNADAGLSAQKTLDNLPRAAIIDANDQTTYDFPTAQTDVEKIVASIQAELRCCAACLGLAEYMVSADASNANFSSTMVAEGSPVKSFESMQRDMIDDDMEVIERAITCAAKNGRLPEDVLDKVTIDAEPPVIISRNRLQETQADEILNRNKVMSKKTWQTRNDLNNDDETAEIEQERDADAAYSIDDALGMGPPATLRPDLPPAPGQPVQKQPFGSSPQQTPPQPSVPTKESVDDGTGLIEVPDIRQTDHYSCGAAAAMCVGKYFGVGPDTLPAWKKALGTDVQQSTSPQAIVNYFSSLGLRVTASSNLTIGDLKAYTQNGSPVIVAVQDYGSELPEKASFDYGHYLTVIGVGMGYVFCQDSSEDNVIANSGSAQKPGRVMIAEADFLKIWYDKDVDGNQYRQFGIAVAK